MKKSELRQMIREVLREELRLREDINEESNLEVTLDKAYRGQSNILITTQPGLGCVASVRKWCDANSVYYVYVNASNIDVLDKIELASINLEDSVLIIDEYNRANPRVRAGLFSLVNEHTYGQLFTVAICSANGDKLNSAEKRIFDIEFNNF